MNGSAAKKDRIDIQFAAKLGETIYVVTTSSVLQEVVEGGGPEG
ncbi:MAG: hypothetical protein ACI9TH_001657 [Kiritimatiellia bacterium]|jgi:hypothetical protein